jgi:hypothetical protein
VHQISTLMNKYFLLFLFLISCSTRDCAIGPNVSIQQKETVKSNTETTKTDSKTIVEQLHDMKENLRPGGQMKCIF